MNKRLKIGILLDGFSLPNWKYRIIEELKSSDYAVIALLIMNSERATAESPESGRYSPIYWAHHKLDKFLFRSKNHYSIIKDLRKLELNVPILMTEKVEKEDGYEFDDTSIADIDKYKLDIILKFDLGNPKGRILRIPRYGLWAYSMDNFSSDNNGVTGYYEVIKKNPVTFSELVIMRDEIKDNLVISRVYESTCSYSVHLNRDRLFRRASIIVPRIINGIHRFGEDHLDKLAKRFRDEAPESKKNIPPTSSLIAGRNWLIAVAIFLRKIIKKIFYSDPFSWKLLFNVDTPGDFRSNSYKLFKAIEPSKDKFWADPFPISKNRRHYIFVEEFVYKTNKGHISVLEMDRKGEQLKVQKLIEKPYHMSYPFIVDLNGEYYMIPESGGNRTIDLYKCKEFPNNWEFVKSIMKGLNAVDTSLFYYNNKWWLFTVIDHINSPLDGSPELYLYFADTLLSDKWESHPLNPIVSDIRTARPAGRLFIQDHKIYRPSQDCSGRYGEAFNISQVLIITENDYEEILIKKVLPDWDDNLKGTHTYNYTTDMTIIDAYSFRRRPFILN